MTLNDNYASFDIAFSSYTSFWSFKIISLPENEVMVTFRSTPPPSSTHFYPIYRIHSKWNEILILCTDLQHLKIVTFSFFNVFNLFRSLYFSPPIFKYFYQGIPDTVGGTMGGGHFEIEYTVLLRYV